MRLWICDSEDEITREAFLWLEANVLKLGARSLFIPAGKSARLLFQQIERVKPEWFRSLELIPVDEVLEGRTPGRFEKFFREELPSFQSQLRSINEPVASADLAILGLGMNGHVAFHEPHVPFDFKYGTVDLEAGTCRDLKVDAGTRRLTYGLGILGQCREILIPVMGQSKKTILERFLKNDRSLPASHLRDRVTVITERSLCADSEAHSDRKPS